MQGIVLANEQDGDTLNPDDKIYRVIPFQRLCRMLVSDQNTLSRPSNWDDPFEDLMAKSYVKTGLKGIGQFRGLNAFAQCWTLQAESDAIWRIYSEAKNGVRLETTVRKLHQSLENHIQEKEKFFCKIGAVKYLSMDQFSEFCVGHFQINPDGTDPSISDKNAETYMVKRDSFSHEKEVRLYFDGNCSSFNISEDEKYFAYKFGFSDVIDSLMFDPRLSDEDFDTNQQIIESLGYQGLVLRSNLYQAPEKLIFYIGESEEQKKAARERPVGGEIA